MRRGKASGARERRDGWRRKPARPREREGEEEVVGLWLGVWEGGAAGEEGEERREIRTQEKVGGGVECVIVGRQGGLVQKKKRFLHEDELCLSRLQ